MELIIFASLYQAKEVPYFYVHFYRRTFYLHNSAGCRNVPSITTSLFFFTFVGALFFFLKWRYVVSSGGALSTGCDCVPHGSFHHWIQHLWLQGAVLPGFNPLRRGWVYRPALEAPWKGECRWDSRHFWNCLTRVGSDPATGPTLKRPCATFLRW